MGLRGVVFGLATIAGVAGASAQDMWEGPYLGNLHGWGAGTATFEYYADGNYGLAGEQFTVPLTDANGGALGVLLGYNWQRGRLVYGLEANFYSRSMVVDDFLRTCPGVPGPPAPATTCDVDFKGHWFPSYMGRIGVALGPVLFYAMGGLAIGHLVTETRVRDSELNNLIAYGFPEATQTWTYGTAIGVTGGVGVEINLWRRVSLGLGYQGTILRPWHVNDDGLNDGWLNGTGTTDQSTRYMNHMFTARYAYHFGQGAAQRRADNHIDWQGFYVGHYIGALWQLGIQAGYDFTIGDKIVTGTSFSFSRNICCENENAPGGAEFGEDYNFDLSARLGYVFRDDILFYAEGGISHHNGSFFGQHTGYYYALGGGIEIALMPHISAFMETKAIGAWSRGPLDNAVPFPADPNFQPGFIDGNFQGGINYHFN